MPLKNSSIFQDQKYSFNAVINNHVFMCQKKKKNHVFPKKQTEIIVFFSFSFLTYCSATNEKPKTKANLKNRGIIRVNMRLELPKHVVAMIHGIRSGGPADESRERPT